MKQRGSRKRLREKTHHRALAEIQSDVKRSKRALKQLQRELDGHPHAAGGATPVAAKKTAVTKDRLLRRDIFCDWLMGAVELAPCRAPCRAAGETLVSLTPKVHSLLWDVQGFADYTGGSATQGLYGLSMLRNPQTGIKLTNDDWGDPYEVGVIGEVQHLPDPIRKLAEMLAKHQVPLDGICNRLYLVGRAKSVPYSTSKRKRSKAPPRNRLGSLGKRVDRHDSILSDLGSRVAHLEGRSTKRRRRDIEKLPILLSSSESESDGEGPVRKQWKQRLREVLTHPEQIEVWPEDGPIPGAKEAAAYDGACSTSAPSQPKRDKGKERLKDSPADRMRSLGQQSAARTWNHEQILQACEEYIRPIDQGGVKLIMGIDSAPYCSIMIRPDVELTVLHHQLRKVMFLGQYEDVRGEVEWRLGKATGFLGQDQNWDIEGLPKDDFGHPILGIITKPREDPEKAKESSRLPVETVLDLDEGSVPENLPLVAQGYPPHRPDQRSRVPGKDVLINNMVKSSAARMADTWNREHIHQALESLWMPVDEGGLELLVSLDTAPPCLITIRPQTTLRQVKDRLLEAKLMGQFPKVHGDDWRFVKIVKFPFCRHEAPQIDFPVDVSAESMLLKAVTKDTGELAIKDRTPITMDRSGSKHQEEEEEGSSNPPKTPTPQELTSGGLGALIGCRGAAKKHQDLDWRADVRKQLKRAQRKEAKSKRQRKKIRGERARRSHSE